jgi:hypothetical protein
MCLKAGRTRWRPSTPTGCAMSGCVVSARKRREPTAARYADGSTRGSPSALLWCVALATCGRMVGLQSAMPCRASIASTSLGLVSLRPPSGIRSIRRSTCWRDDGSPVVVSERWCLAALWTESEPASTVFALLLPGILKRPRKAVNVINMRKSLLSAPFAHTDCYIFVTGDSCVIVVRRNYKTSKCSEPDLYRARFTPTFDPRRYASCSPLATAALGAEFGFRRTQVFTRSWVAKRIFG